MKNIIYYYSSLGKYITEQNTAFGEEREMSITVRPHEFSIAVGGDTLRQSACGAYEILVSVDGAAVIRDENGAVLAEADKTDTTYNEARIDWEPGALSVTFGCMVTVDYYPDCDGESDRYGEKWVTQRAVILHTEDNSVEIR